MQAAKRDKRSSGNRKGPRGTSVQFMLPFEPTPPSAPPPPRPPEPRFNPHYVGFPFGAPSDAE